MNFHAPIAQGQGTLRILDGSPFYDGPLWKELSVEEKTARIREGIQLGISHRKMAALFGALRAEDGKPSTGIVSGHIRRHLSHEYSGQRGVSPLRKKKVLTQSQPGALKPVAQLKNPRKPQIFFKRSAARNPTVREEVPPLFLGEVSPEQAREVPDGGFCKWPIGELEAEDFRYCWREIPKDAPRKRGRLPVYCEHHQYIGAYH